MLAYNDEDLQKWGLAMTQASTTEARAIVAKKIWEDGYRTAEAEVTYAHTGEVR